MKNRLTYLSQSNVPIQIAATPSNFGRYDPFLYKDWRYPADARNNSENNPEFQNTEVPIKRVVEPAYLCFINHLDEIERCSLSDWRKRHGPLVSTDYVFVSFTAEHYGSGGFDDLFLTRVGKHAAKKARVSAYWISKSCLSDPQEKDAEKREMEREKMIWTIGDIVRRALAVAIAVPGYLDDEDNSTYLQEWGDRVWTMPELLLYTGHHSICVYQSGKFQLSNMADDQPRQIPRRELWSKVWSDHAYSGQLIDHYESSLILSPLELATTALLCLHTRNLKEYKKGDRAYAMMFLLRQRPNVVTTDSDFQAFARLSLANDSNLLLERMMCLLPKNPDDEWWSLDDAWNVMLWDVYPHTQICGIGEDDTVILDGAHGAAIRWDKFIPVLTLGQERLRHTILRWFLRVSPVFIWMGLLFTIVGATQKSSTSSNKSGTPSDKPGTSSNQFGTPSDQSGTPSDQSGTPLDQSGTATDKSGTNYARSVPLYLGAVILSLSGVIILTAPYLLRFIYRAKVHESQPLFFGLEGYIDLYHLELLIFGSFEGKLQWSTASSPLSRHGLDRNGMKKDFFKDMQHEPDELEHLMKRERMYTGLDPVETDPDVRTLEDRARTSSCEDKKIFTLVDTYTMSVTLFEAVRPPVAVVVCGAEGGMQRALLCSQDWTSGTLYRETVLRMETRVKDRMDVLPRVRLGMSRKDARGEIQEPTQFKRRNKLWRPKLSRPELCRPKLWNG